VTRYLRTTALLFSSCLLIRSLRGVSLLHAIPHMLM
jgi:hypothetical protein